MLAHISIISSRGIRCLAVFHCQLYVCNYIIVFYILDIIVCLVWYDMVGMDSFALKSFVGDDDSDPKYYHLSQVCHGVDSLVIANAYLPFEIDNEVYGSSCRDLV